MKIVDQKHYKEALCELFNYLIEYKREELSDPSFNYFTFLDITLKDDARKIEVGCDLIRDMEDTREWFWEAERTNIATEVKDATLQAYIGAWLTAAFLSIYPELANDAKSYIPKAIDADQPFQDTQQFDHYLAIVDFLNQFN